MNAKERALQRFGLGSQSAPSPALTQDNQEEDKEDRKARTRARLQNNKPLNSSVHSLQEDDAVHLPEDSVGRDNIPEAADVSGPEPMTQGDLFTYYKDKNPELFNEQGTVVDFDKAVDLGILTRLSLVPEDNPLELIQPHSSTENANTPYKYVYNEPDRAVEIVQTQAEADRRSSLNRRERLAETKAEREQALEDEAADFGMDTDEFIEKVAIPSIDKDESPYLSAFCKQHWYGFNCVQCFRRFRKCC